MSVEAAIHDRWANTGALTALVPVDRVVTGVFHDESKTDLPYVQVNREGDPTHLRTNTGNRMDQVSIRFQAWHSVYASGQAISDAIIAAFDDVEWTVGSTRVVQSRKSNDFAIEEDDGGWQFVIDFEMLSHQTS